MATQGEKKKKQKKVLVVETVLKKGKEEARFMGWETTIGNKSFSREKDLREKS